MPIKIQKKYVIQTILLFLFFLFWNLIINVLQNDEIWNYGFAHNIYSGLVPYKDFNMVVTPLYPFIMSLPFHLFGSSILLFHIENVVILVASIWFIYYFLKDKIYYVLLFLMLFSNSLTSPGYNLFLIFLFYFILYLEKEKKNDYLIGFLIALSFLTKQSIGLFFLFPSLYYLKSDGKRIIKRLIGFIVPCLIFLFYLILSHSLSSFFDLCLFGLFDFGEKNGSFKIGIVFFVLYFIICFYLIRKDKKNLNHYYVLAFASMMIPIFDFYHIAMTYLVLFIHLLFIYDFKIKIPIKPIFYCSVMGIGMIMFFTYHSGYTITYPNDVSHFQYRMIREDSLSFTHSIVHYIQEHPNQRYLFVVSGGYYFRLVTDTKMSYLDLINYGNFGYHGTEKLIDMIQKNKDAVFIISEGDLSDACQADKKAIRYIIENGEKIDSIQIYDFYVLK